MSSSCRLERAAFLGIERSLTGRRWAARLADERAALAMAQRHGLPDAICRLLAAREVELESVGDFLDPTLRRFLPDPLHLRDMDAAVDRLVRAVRGGERVVVFGDYDVDGATSAALLLRFFRAVGGDIGLYIPDRRSEGYGPNTTALLKLKAAGASVAVTVDCGVTAYEPLAEAKRAGLDVIVIDHHQAEIDLPEATAVVDPNRIDDDSPHKQLAAVGVAFLLCVAVNRALREAGWYGAACPEPDLRQWLDLVALGTVCDVVPLTGVNRALVRQGLHVMRRRGNLGLAALADIARLREPPGAYHLGFMLGPRVNAGGRVGQADLGARLLASDDAHEVGALALRLDEFNAERRAIEREVLDQAIARIEGLYGPERHGLPSVLLVESEGWHIGVVGIVASRLVERYGRPAFVIGIDGESGDVAIGRGAIGRGAIGRGAIGRGSGRSVRGVDLGAAVIAARQAGLLVNGGGHAMAAGVTVVRDTLPELAHFLDQRIAPQLGAAPAVRELGIDAALTPAG
ncbi:MAG: DHH family phosphoesterase, partial [Alphaproteobacteria bacterium]|nr:DHH family phosphoesterase [Alphaproteobacteria bacterium]